MCLEPSITSTDEDPLHFDECSTDELFWHRWHRQPIDEFEEAMYADDFLNWKIVDETKQHLREWLQMEQSYLFAVHAYWLENIV